MKTVSINSFTLLIFFCFVCSSCNKFSAEFTKRKYRSGFYVDVSKSAKTSEARQNTFRNHLASAKNQTKNEPAVLSSTLPEKCPDSLVQPLSVKTEMNPDKSKNKIKSAGKINQPELKPDMHEQNYSYVNPTEPVGKKTDPTNKNIFYWIAGLAALGSSGMFMLNRKRNLKVSKWSKRHSSLSRAIQAVGHTVLGVGSFMAGSILYKHHAVADPTAFNIFTAAFLASSALYPYKKPGRAISNATYIKYKMGSLAVILSGMMMSASLGNQVAAERETASTQHIIAIQPAQHLFEKISANADQLNSTFFASEDQPEAKHFSGGQIGLMVLTIILSIVLSLVVAGLSCSLSCDGNEGLANIVLIGGLALLIGLSIAAIRGIVNMSNKKAEPKAIPQK